MGMVSYRNRRSEGRRRRHIALHGLKRDRITVVLLPYSLPSQVLRELQLLQREAQQEGPEGLQPIREEGLTRKWEEE